MNRTNDWNDWYLFACVANLGNFTRAAERLDLPKSSVSTAISRLEKRLGLRLLERSTRHLRLTEAGNRLLQDINPLFARLDDVADHLAGLAEAPLTGTLRIAAPYEFAGLHLSPVVNGLLADYPELRVEVEVVSGITDPLSSGFDVSFVITSQPLPDSSQVMRRMYSIEQAVYAAPSLIARLGMPTHPDALHHWPLLGSATALPWHFRHQDGERYLLEAALRLQTPNAGLRQQAAVAGIGAGLLGRNYTTAAVLRGELVELLPGWRAEPLKTYALMPNRTLLPTKTRLLLQGLEQKLQEQGERSGMSAA
ncbi:MAG TPA: LysR family transcriptional regulator [Chromobacteriaceae bacterium]|nr:LysR family transcriptional regulator [Chromobacteriaceae bacterium]